MQMFIGFRSHSYHTPSEKKIVLGQNHMLLAPPNLDEGTPEELVGAALVLAGEEIDSCRDELLQAQLAVVVRVNRLESGSGHLRIESDDVEKQLVLVFLDLAVGVGVDCAEEERQGTGERLPQSRVLNLLLERRDESVLVQRLTGRSVLQIFLPDLRIQSQHTATV